MSEEHDNANENEPAIDPGLTDEQANGLDQLQPDFVPGGDDDKPKAPPKNAQSVAMVTMVLGAAFNILAARLGDHWQLQAAEAQAIAEPAVAVLDKYVPDFETGPELALVAALGMVVLPRAMKQKELAEEGASDGDQSQPDAG